MTTLGDMLAEHAAAQLEIAMMPWWIRLTGFAIARAWKGLCYGVGFALAWRLIVGRM